MKKLWRIPLAAVAVLVFDTAVAMLTCEWLFKWVYEIEPTGFWKEMSGGPPWTYYVAALVLNIILVLIYALIKNGLPGKSVLVKGLMFGLIIWAVGMLQGAVAMHFFTVTALEVSIYWTVLGLVQLPLGGVIIAAIYGK